MLFQGYIGDRNETGQRDGQGKALLPNHNQFVGEYRKGLRQGFGVMEYKIGARYEGDWKNGMKQGEGKFSYPDGSWYFGKWCRNQKHGFGKYVYANGDYYDGYWRDDVKHGSGLYKYQEADITIKATWMNGVVKGSIEIIYQNCHFYGHWNKGSAIGEGIFTFDMKSMVTGHVPGINRKTSQKTSQVGSLNSATSKVEPVDLNEVEQNEVPEQPKFRAHEIELYDLKKIPDPVVTKESKESVCSKVSITSSMLSRLSAVNTIITKCIDKSTEEAKESVSFLEDSGAEA